jgi:hypothetical protein
MRKQPLQVSLHVKQPSLVKLTIADRVQLDRLVPSPDGYLAERHGDLLVAGVATLALAQGHYFFKTLSPAHLKVIHGGVDAAQGVITKDGPPPPIGQGNIPSPSSRGSDASSELLRFTIEQTEEW